MTTPTPDPDDDRLGGALRASRVLVDAPEALIQRAIDLFEPTRQRAPRGLLPRLRAVLEFDSGQASPLAYGMRSAGGDMRQLLYTLEGCDVDLRVASAEGTVDLFVLSGQLLGPDSRGVVVAERGSTDTAEPARAALNELGEFRLPPLPAGSWRLTLELADRAIELPVLELATGPAAAV